MAHVYPERLPDFILKEAKRSSEIKFFNALREIPNSWFVFYGVNMIGRPGGTRHYNVDAEADFIIGHPEKGIVVAEVKGGRIHLENGVWYSTDRNGIVHKIKDPIDQAKNNKYILKSKLERSSIWPRSFINFGHCAVLPDVNNPGGALGLHAPDQIIIFREDLENIENKLNSVFDYFSRNGPGKDGIQALRSLVAPSVKLKKTISTDVTEAQKQVIELTEQQYKLLDFIAAQNRVLINGGAGTGKTFIAIEKAVRLAEQGEKVLLTCFSPALASFIRSRAPKIDNLIIQSFHNLCREWAAKANVELPTEEITPREELIVRLPDALLQATEKLEDRFTAIIVDEGQDFQDSWWLVIQFLLAEPETGILYIFFDDNQNTASQNKSLPEGLLAFTLNENLRNARPIHECAKKFFAGKSLRSSGPPNGKVDFFQTNQENLYDALAKYLRQLMDEEGIRPEQIAILTAKKYNESEFMRITDITGLPISHPPDLQPGHLIFDSISRFKGLEAPVVILIEMEEICTPGKISLDKIYVGMTRASSYLTIFGTPMVINFLKR
jgi:hypothetical protein